MNLASAAPLVTAAMNILTLLIEKILASQHMNEEEKKNALGVISSELDKTVEKVKNVKFDALKPKP